MAILSLLSVRKRARYSIGGSRRSHPRPFVELLEGRALLSNLLANGDFSLGDVGFTSQLDSIPIGGSHSGPGYYGIVHNPSTDISPIFASFGDHTTGTGLMLAADASPAPDAVVWQETVDVSSGTDYVFSGWAGSMGQYPIGTPVDPSPARLGFFINGVQIGSEFVVSAQNGQWSQFSAAWNSGANGVATINIVDMDTDAVGNDFTLDDLSCTFRDLRNDEGDEA